MPVLRLIFLLTCLALVGYGVRYERHAVQRFGEDEAAPLSGPGFVSGATVDSYLLRDSQLFDVYSLSKATAGIKDCAT